MSFSDEIMIIRQKSFLTQTEFAAKINVAYNTVNRWETGKSRPNMLNAAQEIRHSLRQNLILQRKNLVGKQNTAMLTLSSVQHGTHTKSILTSTNRK